jgi:hypothetical protein
VSVRQFLPPLQETALFSMSVKIMSDVFENSKTEGNARLVLLCLADCANDEGACWPSIRKIAQKANLSEPIAKKYLNALIETGVVNREEREDQFGRQTSNYYTILIDRIGNDEITRDVLERVTPKSRLSSREGVTPVSGGGTNASYGVVGVTPVSLTIMNHHKEPKKEPSSDSAIAPSNSSIENEELFTMKVAESPSAPKPRKAKPVDDSFIAELKKLNPTKDVDAQVIAAKNWLLAHPPRQFTKSFFSAWINRTKPTIDPEGSWKPTTI